MMLRAHVHGNSAGISGESFFLSCSAFLLKCALDFNSSVVTSEAATWMFSLISLCVSAVCSFSRSSGSGSPYSSLSWISTIGSALVDGLKVGGAGGGGRVDGDGVDGLTATGVGGSDVTFMRFLKHNTLRSSVNDKQINIFTVCIYARVAGHRRWNINMVCHSCWLNV